MEPAVTAAVLTIAFTALATLIGLVYRNLNNRLEALEDETNENSGNHISLRERVDTIWNFLFGVRDDPQDTGLSGEIEKGFNNIEKELSQTQSKQEEYHTKEMDTLETLVNELHDEESVGIERDDILED